MEDAQRWNRVRSWVSAERRRILEWALEDEIGACWTTDEGRKTLALLENDSPEARAARNTPEACRRAVADALRASSVSCPRP